MNIIRFFSFFSLFLVALCTGDYLFSVQFVIENDSMKRKELKLKDDSDLASLCINLAEKLYPMVIKSENLFLFENYVPKRSLCLFYKDLFLFDFEKAADLLIDVLNNDRDIVNFAESIKNEIEDLPKSDEVNIKLRTVIVEKVLNERFLGKLIDELNSFLEIKSSGGEITSVVNKECEKIRFSLNNSLPFTGFDHYLFRLGLKGAYFQNYAFIKIVLHKIVEFHRQQLLDLSFRFLKSGVIRSRDLKKRVINNISKLLPDLRLLERDLDLESLQELINQSIKCLIPDDKSLVQFCLNFLDNNNIAIEPDLSKASFTIFSR